VCELAKRRILPVIL